MPADVAEFVVLNPDFPRSIVFSGDSGWKPHLPSSVMEGKEATRRGLGQSIGDGYHQPLWVSLMRGCMNIWNV
jgi:hypothetical protein